MRNREEVQAPRKVQFFFVLGFAKSLLPHSDFPHTFVYLISFLIDKLPREVTRSIIIQRNVYITQINIIEDYGLGVYLLHMQLRKMTVLWSKYMLHLNNVITITDHQVFPWCSGIRIYRKAN